MRKRRRLLGLFFLAAVVGLALVALRQSPTPSRSGPRPAPEPAEGVEHTGVSTDEGFAEGTLWGTVTVPEGIDVTEVRLSVLTKLGILPSSNTAVSPFSTSLKVGQDGRFRGDGLPLGEYKLLAEHPSCACCRKLFELRPGCGTGPLHVVLGNRGSLLVRIAGPDGRGLSGEHVALHRGEGTPEHIEYRLEPAKPEVGRGCTDADGEVRFANLDSGTYTLTRRGTVAEQCTAVVRADHETVVLFDASGSLFGSLLGHDERPISGAKLLLRASGRVYETRTDYRGAFAIRGIAPGNYTITASVKELGAASIPLAESIAVENGRAHQQELQLPAIRLTGSVVHAESGAPFTSRRASVSASALRLLSHVMARTAADGRFELAGLYPGRYQVRAYPSDPEDEYDESASEIVTIHPTPDTQELVLRMTRVAKTACLRLTVRDRHGNPAEDLSFSIDGRSREVYAKGIRRNRDARLVVPGVYDIPLVPGTHCIRVSTRPTPTEKGSWAKITVEVASGETIEREIALNRLGE